MQKAHIDAVSTMQSYIEDHIKEPITLLDLARVSHYSPYYAAKLFKTYTDLSPFDYIRKRRLTLAAKFMQHHKTPVIDVALTFLFDSHEGFTRAFSKTFGIAPKTYQLHNKPIPWILPYDAKSRHISKIRKGDDTINPSPFTLFTQVIKRPKRKAIILRGKAATNYYAYCEEVGCDIYGILASIKEALYEPAGMWLPNKLIKEGSSPYVHGVEVPYDYTGDIPKECDLITLDAQDYMVFQSTPYNDENFEEAIRNTWDALKTYDPTLYGYTFDKTNAPSMQLEPHGYRGYIEMHPVKPL
ncbi:MAG: helix-turn-helix domain-containing protein [Bacillota bacterium]